MKLYNTQTRKLEDITPLNAPIVTVYTCGPTVYDYLHVGNWFTYIREDLLIRALRLSGLQPNWVMNITDVGHLVSDADEGEDKLEKGAHREGKTAWDIAKFYTDYFERGLKRLNISQPDKLPRATDHIAEQIELIQQLEAKGYTYVISDGVYFDTSKFPKYASFARLDLDEQQAGKRVEYNREKRNPTDFALWKFSPTDHQRDMEWDSPWSPPNDPTGARKGFPGWHVECSAMSMKYLGDTLDIHAGGIDHIPVHHTNEIAQSEAVTGQSFARYWMHSNHVTVEGEKISKSLGNGITLEDIEARGISLEAFRLHVLESHYRSQSKFSWDSLEAAQNRLHNLRQFSALVWQPRETGGAFDYSRARQRLTDDLTDDLNTPHALAQLSTLANTVSDNLVAPAEVTGLHDFIALVRDALGVDISTPDINDEQKAVIAAREQARADKNWATSDELRAQLSEQGIGLRDTPYGAIWFRI